ncbi:bacteriocin propeptide [Leptolyngbya sp. NIES-3755]|nr:bacteriocin propeptide [Leptolyngbya sp. NIES-3755]
MSQQHAAAFFKAVQKDHVLQNRLQASSDPQFLVELANERGYSVSESDIEEWLDRLPESELAALFNPGIGGRQRLIPR